MHTEDKLNVALKEIGDLKAALDEHAIVVITDPQGAITYVNDKFCAISHYTRDELIGQDHRLVNSGHHPKAFMRELWATIGSGLVWHGEIRNKARDGTFYWVDTTIVPFLDGEGKPRQYIAICADIPEKRRTEKALSASELRYRRLFETAKDGILILDAETGMVVDVNPFLIGLLGFSHEQFLGKAIWELGFFKDIVANEDKFSELREKEYLRYENMPLETINGDRIEVEFISNVYLVSGSKVIQCLVRDVTARRKAEEAVVERTAQLEEANKELEAFSYSVSHDLRAPLRAMDGFSLAVLEDYGTLLPEEGRHYLQTIRAGAQRMGALIDDLLAFSRLSRQPIKKQVIGTPGLVRVIREEMESQLQGRRIEVKTEALPDCCGDPSLMKQVWINLLSNAFKYTRQCEHAIVEIGSLRRGDETVFFVRDNGTGFDMRYAGKLFGVFQRLHRAEDYEGTGVGLAIVQRIVHRHGGRVWAEAAPGLGATFFFTLGGTKL